VPWNWLTKLALLLVAWRLARSRQAGRPMVDVQAVRSRIASAREPAGIAGRLLVILVLAVPCAALIVAGITALVLSPQWLGATMVGVAAIPALATVPQIVQVRRALRARRLRLHEGDLNRELDSSRPA
jgi:hypothetical protein